MNHIHNSKKLTYLDKFDAILNKLIQDKRNQNLDYAITSWCNELSINTHFPQASKEIVGNINQWIQDSTVFTISFDLYLCLLRVTDKKITKGLGNITVNFDSISRRDFYHNIKETKHKMSTKSILLIAFVLTGVGLLLFLLNKKELKKNSEDVNQSNAYLAYQPPVREKYILALLINSDRDQELIFSLKKNNYLKPEHSSKLYGATQGLWIGTESKFNQSKIKKEFNNSSSDTTKSEYDVHFLKIELDGNDSRFNPNVNQMDRRDAFIELAKRSPKISVSPRLSCKAYEHTEFYSR